jgi:hypothetical protein
VAANRSIDDHHDQQVCVARQVSERSLWSGGVGWERGVYGVSKEDFRKGVIGYDGARKLRVVVVVATEKMRRDGGFKVGGGKEVGRLACFFLWERPIHGRTERPADSALRAAQREGGRGGMVDELGLDQACMKRRGYPTHRPSRYVSDEALCGNGYGAVISFAHGRC